MARPLPDNVGVGFTDSKPLDVKGCKYEVLGRFHNYYFTKENYDWPLPLKLASKIIVDGFSPNLNKQLHVGHLRNLALAKSLHSIYADTDAKFIAFLGCSLGILPEAVDNLNQWFEFLNYHPKQYRDIEVSEKHPVSNTQPGEGEYAGCEVWQGAKSPVVVRRSNGIATYAYHDLAFAQAIGPTHYLTGLEQKEHFQNLGFGDKHLPMGLVLDPVTKKKMKSRDGNALSAKEALELTIKNLEETSEPKKLAWNVLAWNFLHINRSKDVLFEIDNWTKPDAPGLYITYTYARIMSALKDKTQSELQGELSDRDLEILGFSAYFTYWKQRAADTMDPNPLANYAHELARKLGNAYHAERIQDGRQAFQYALTRAIKVLEECMKNLGLFTLVEV